MTILEGRSASGTVAEHLVEVPSSRVVDYPEAERQAARRKMTASGLITIADLLVLVAFAALVPDHRRGLTVFAVAAFVMLRHAGLQRPRLNLSVLDDLPVLGTVLAAALGVSVTIREAFRAEEGMGSLVAWIFIASVALAAERVVSYSVVRSVRASGRVSHPTVVIGCGRIGAQITSALLDNPAYGLRPVGFLDDAPLLLPEERPVPLLADTENLAKVITENGIHVVVVAFSSRSEMSMVDVLRTCDGLGVEIMTVPRLFEVHSTSRGGDTVRGLPLVRLRRPTFRTASWRVKRIIDVAASSLALFALSPVLAALAIAVRFEGGPGIIFRQRRIGIDGRGFDVLKFRSLKPVDETESATMWNISNDDRMGPVGRIIRKLSLDELPQLWNILRGDMSLVGPRPERPHFVDQFSQEYREYVHRHRVPCGLTGWAQVNGLRGDTSIGERARYDNYYIENWSLWLDIKIMIRTVAQVIRMAGG